MRVLLNFSTIPSHWSGGGIQRCNLQTSSTSSLTPLSECNCSGAPCLQNISSTRRRAMVSAVWLWPLPLGEIIREYKTVPSRSQRQLQNIYTNSVEWPPYKNHCQRWVHGPATPLSSHTIQTRHTKLLNIVTHPLPPVLLPHCTIQEKWPENFPPCISRNKPQLAQALSTHQDDVGFSWCITPLITSY